MSRVELELEHVIWNLEFGIRRILKDFFDVRALLREGFLMHEILDGGLVWVYAKGSHSTAASREVRRGFEEDVVTTSGS